MNRRGFFKTILATPTLLTPFLLAAKRSFNDSELFLICEDSPRFISYLLKELNGKHILPSGKNFTFLTHHPQAEKIAGILAHQGWKYTPDPSQADLALSFSRLQQPARPSFAFVKNGQVWDLRSQKLLALWRNINKNQPSSSCMTTAGLRHRSSSPQQAGKYAVIFADGHPVDKIPLNETQSKRYKTLKGTVCVRVEKNKAWISESSCRHHICRYTPPVFLAGERIICAPNHFLLEIQGNLSVDTIIG